MADEAVGGMGTVERFENIEPTLFIEEILGWERNTYNLRNVCRLVQVPELHGTYRVATRDTVQRKVEELQEADLKSAIYSTVDLALWKNVGHVAFSDESQKRGTGPLFTLEIQDTARDLGRAENADIADELAAGGNATAAGGLWTVDTNDPADDVLPIVATMMTFDLGYEANSVLMHPLVYAAFVRNQMVAAHNTLHTQLVLTGKISECYGLPILVDNALTATRAYIIDKNAPSCILAQGGTVAERYRDPTRGFDGYIIRQWLQPRIIRDRAGAQCPVQYLTGVV